MSYTQTTNLELYKESADEPIKNLRVHNNSNMDTLDTQIKALQDVIVNAKALLGQLGVDANGDPLIDDAAARAVLNAAADGTSGDESLYSVNQQAAENAVAIASLQNSVSNSSVSFSYIASHDATLAASTEHDLIQATIPSGGTYLIIGSLLAWNASAKISHTIYVNGVKTFASWAISQFTIVAIKSLNSGDVVKYSINSDIAAKFYRDNRNNYLHIIRLSAS